MASPRDPELETAIVDSPTDPGPWLVLADSYEEQGHARAAAAFRSIASADDAALTTTVQGVVAALVQQRVYRDGDGEGTSMGFGDAPSLEALRTGLADAPASEVVASVRWLAASLELTERDVSQGDEASVAPFAALRDRGGFSIDLPWDADGGSFDLAEVMIYGATVGIEGSFVWRAGTEVDPVEAMCALAASAEFLEPEAYNEMGVEERRVWFFEELFDDDFEWKPLSLRDFTEWYFAQLANNDGEDVIFAGEAQPPSVVLEALGPYEFGVFTDGAEFPITFFAFEKAYLFSKLVY